MRTQITRCARTLFENLDIISGVLCALIGSIILYLSYIGRIDQPIIAIILIVSSVIYLILRSRLKENSLQDFQLTYRQKTILSIIFLVLVLVTSILWYDQLYSRPLIYFIIIAFLSGLISIEILFFTREDNVVPVLLKIFFLTFVMRLGVFYNFPSIMGYDAYFHTTLANIISTTGFVPPFDISDKYVAYPMVHIFIAFTKIISFIPIKDAVFFSIGIISVVCTIFVFIFVNRFAGPRVGLLSVLVICFTTDIIVTGITNITAGSLVLCYFLMLLCLLIDRERNSKALLICLIIIFTMVITHQLATFVVFLTLSLFALSLLIYEHVFTLKNAKIKFSLFLTLFGIAMIFYWIYTPLNYQQSFFDGILGPFIEILQTGGEYGGDVLITGQKYIRPFLDTFLLQFSYLILPFFAIGGIFFWLSRKDDIKFSVAFSAAALFFLVYAIPLSGIRNVLTDRWIPFLSIFLGIVAAAYIISCTELFKSNTKRVVTIFLIVSIVTFFMIVPPGINKDNPLVGKDRTVRNQYKFNEIEAIKTITLFHGNNLITDTNFESLFLTYGSYDSIEEKRRLDDSLSSFLSEQQLLEASEDSGSLTILRKSTLNEPITLKASQLYGDNYAAPLPQTIIDFFENTSNQDLIFSNGNVIGYYSR